MTISYFNSGRQLSKMRYSNSLSKPNHWKSRSLKSKMLYQNLASSKSNQVISINLLL